jgi:hypothetical protein
MDSSSTTLWENTMTHNIRFLRRVMAIDAIATGAMALGFVAMAGPLSEIFGLPSLALTCIGLVLLPFAAWVGWLAKQRHPPLKLVRILVAANVIWAADSLLLAFGNWMPLTAIGTEFVAFQAVITLVAATLEWTASQRSLTSHESRMTSH